MTSDNLARLKRRAFLAREHGRHDARSRQVCNDAADAIFEMAEEIERLEKIESAALACDGIEMESWYEVPISAFEDLMKAAWEGKVADPIPPAEQGEGRG